MKRIDTFKNAMNSRNALKIIAGINNFDTEKVKNVVTIVIAFVAIIILAIVVYMLVMVDSPTKAVNTMFNEIKSGSNGEEKIAEFLQEGNLNEEARKSNF